MEKTYNLSEQKRIVIKDNKAEIQIYRAIYSYPSGAYCGYSWFTELTLTEEEFENLKKLLTT